MKGLGQGIKEFKSASNESTQVLKMSIIKIKRINNPLFPMDTYRSLRAIQSALQADDITCLSLTQSYLQRIHDHQDLNAFLEVYEDESLASAQVVDDKLKAGTAGRLAGMVIGIKDNICYKGHRLSAASKILDGFESMFSATVVERLLAQDAIIIGRTNCDEFAMGSTNENSTGYFKSINTKCVSGVRLVNSCCSGGRPMFSFIR